MTAPASGADQALTGDNISVQDFEIFTRGAAHRADGHGLRLRLADERLRGGQRVLPLRPVLPARRRSRLSRSTYFDGTTFPRPVDHRGRFGTRRRDRDQRLLHRQRLGRDRQRRLRARRPRRPRRTRSASRATGASCCTSSAATGSSTTTSTPPTSASRTAPATASRRSSTIPTRSAPDRFLTFPWVSLIGRRHDRPVGGGWAWGGVQDDGGYSPSRSSAPRTSASTGASEATRPSLAMRQFAARVTALPDPPRGRHADAQHQSVATRAAGSARCSTADTGDWTSEGLSGGAYGKVIRWAFEKQGLFQAAGAPTPVTKEGSRRRSRRLHRRRPPRRVPVPAGPLGATRTSGTAASQTTAPSHQDPWLNQDQLRLLPRPQPRHADGDRESSSRRTTRTRRRARRGRTTGSR